MNITDQLKLISEKVDKSVDLKRCQADIEKILKTDPHNQFALYLKAKIFIALSDKRRKKNEALELINRMAGVIESPVYLYRKWELLGLLDSEDPELFEERIKICQKILALPHVTSGQINYILLERFAKLPPPHIQPKTPIHTDKPQTQTPPPPPPPPPELKADFTAEPLSGLIPLEVRFYDRSTSESNLSYHWDFGDGSESNEKNPVHIYGDEGLFSVLLRIKDQNGREGSNLKGSLITVSNGKGGELKENGPDPEGIFEPQFIRMIEEEDEIINIIRSGPGGALRLKGLLMDLFEGETPREYYILATCIDERIPDEIINLSNDQPRLDARLESIKNNIVNQNHSSEYVEWAIRLWKSALLSEKVRSTLRSTELIVSENDDVIY